jgi:protein HEXIM1/2
MTKTQLIQEYLQLEEKVDMLEKRLRKSQSVEVRGQMNDTDTDIEKGELQVDEETSHKIQLFQQEINKLLKENEKLRLENDCLRQSCDKGDVAPSVSSVDSESDSTCSSASNLSDDSLGRERGSANESENKDIPLRTCDTNSAEVE